MVFRNPAKHAGDKAEKIPPKGQDNGKGTAVMIMLKGDTLTAQFKNAAALVKRYKLDKQGLSAAFIKALSNGKALDLVAEAYGPADLAAQAAKLDDVKWTGVDGVTETIIPVRGPVCAYGARKAAEETAFRTMYDIYVKGTNTVAELVESEGMIIAVSENWETGAETTRPIVPSVARGFYGEHFDNMPVVRMNSEGMINTVDLKNGQIVERFVDYRLVTAPEAKLA